MLEGSEQNTGRSGYFVWAWIQENVWFFSSFIMLGYHFIARKSLGVTGITETTICILSNAST